MPKYLSGKVKVNPQDKLSSYRNTYLELGDAEPNLGNPATLGIVNGGSSAGIPAGTRYQSITIHGDTTGNRYWIPVGGGVIPGSISVFEEGVIVGTADSISQLNFVGNIVTAIAEESVEGGSPGNIATITVRPTTNDKEILFSKDVSGLGVTDFSGSSDFTFNYNTGIVSVTTGIHIAPIVGSGATFNVGAGGSVFRLVSAGSTSLVGIGTTNPTQNLDVKGNIKLDGDLHLVDAGTIIDYTGNFGAEANILTKGEYGVEWLRPNQIVSGAAATVTVLQYHKTGGILGGASNYNSGTGAMSIAVVWDPTNNRLGIGSTQPSSLLDVEGNSIFTGITSFVGLTTVTEGGLGANTLTVSGLSTFNGVIDANNGINASSAKIEDLVGDRVVFTSTGGELQTSNNISYNTTDGLNVTGLITATNLAASGVGTIANIEIGGSNNNEIKTLSAGLILSSASTLVRIDDKVEVNDNTDSTNSLDGALISDGGLGVAKNANIGKNVNVGGALSVTGTSVGVAVTLSAAGGITTVGGDLYVGGDLFVLDDIFLDEGRFNTLIVDKGSTFRGNIDAQANVGVGSIIVSGVSTFTGNIEAKSNLDVDGITDLDVLNVSETATFDGNINANQNLDVDGTTDLDVLNVAETATFSSNIDVDGITDLDVLNVSETATFVDKVSIGGTVGFGKSVFLPDNKRILFGSDDDLEIFFDGTHSKIDHLPTGGSLFLAGDSLILSNSGMSEYYLQAAENGSVLLNYSGNTKLKTSGVGVTVYNQLDVTDIVASGEIGINESDPKQKLHITQTAGGEQYPILLQNRTNGDSSVGIQFIATGSDLSDGQYASIEANGPTVGNTKHDLLFKTVTSGGTPKEALRITSDGHVGIGTDNPTGANALLDNNTILAVGSLKANNLEGSYIVPGETGQVFFNNSDVLTAASTLYWDEPNDRLGIGTDDPQCVLDINKDVAGGVNYVDIRNHHATGGAALRVKTQGTYASPTYQAILGASDADGTIRVGAVSNHDLLLLTNDEAKVTIKSSGEVGINTTTVFDTNTMLQVNGKTGAGPNLVLHRNDTSVSVNQVLGALRVTGNDSNGTQQESSAIEFVADLDHGTNDKPGRIVFKTTNDGALSATEKLRINSSGQVSVGSEPSSGIGTLNVKPSSDDEYLKVRDAGDFDASYNGVAIDCRNSANNASKDILVRSERLSLWQGSSEKLLIDTGGNLIPGSNSQNIGSATTSWGTIYGNLIGDIQGVADNVETTKNDALSSGYLTFVDSNNTTATGEVIYTSTNFEIDSSTGTLKLPKTDGGIKFGPGTATNDDAHIEWKGDGNAGYLRISTSDDNGTEYIQFGDYASNNKNGAFTEWLKIQRTGANLTGQLYVSGISTVNNNLDVNGVATFNDTTDATNSTTGGSVTIDGGAAIAKSLFVGINLDVGGTLVVDGNVTLGEDASDTVTFNADIASNLYPSAHETYNIGESASNRWNQVYAKEFYGTFKGDIANTVATLSLDASVTDVFDISSNSLSADDAGADKLVIWDDTNGKLTHAGLGTGLYYSGTNLDSTTYDFELVDHGSNTGSGTGNDAVLRLNPSTGSDDDIRLIAGSNITLSQGTGTLTVSSTDTTSNNLYKLECAQTGGTDADPKISLQSNGGTGSTYTEADSIQINGGSYCTVTRDNDGSLTINASDQTGTTYDLEGGGTQGTSFGSGTGTINLISSEPTTDTVTVTAGSNIKITKTGSASDFTGGFTISADQGSDTVTNAYKTINTPDDNSVTSNSTTEQLTFKQSGGMTITSNSTTNEITFSSTNTNTEYNYNAVDDDGAVKLRLSTIGSSPVNQDIEIAGTTDEIEVTQNNSGKITLSMATGYSAGLPLSSSSKRFDVLAWTDSVINGKHTYVGDELYFFNSNKLDPDATISFSDGTNFVFNHNILPSGTIDLGSTTARWNNIYVNDLQLSNESKKDTGGNDVDGTWGDWTLQEGEDNVYMINNRTGKKYAMMLKEVEH